MDGMTPVGQGATRCRTRHPGVPRARMLQATTAKAAQVAGGTDNLSLSPPTPDPNPRGKSEPSPKFAICKREWKWGLVSAGKVGALSASAAGEAGTDSPPRIPQLRMLRRV